jgi:hypothetical protein
VRKRVVFAVVSVAVLFGVGASTSLADPNLTTVAPHRHLIGGIEVGPRVCDDPNLQEAHNQFHNNLHVATASSIGPVAPGLHDGQGPAITFAPC